ncbi:hypothetical protein O181_014605 [Austropuccinia psidii MF-1]|uniref:DUF7143 domain-containing protein n=1 Tax=Austropuccinia psidii MF-1 TaxID=1389203 RepID=A0A9Q3C199_9BASI|nr:hypothetical protein [Austropuccinia psidii MF-1]
MLAFEIVVFCILGLLELSVSVMTQKPCFLIGSQPIPSDVRPNPNVTCPGPKVLFGAVPDLSYNKVLYSTIDFQLKGTLSPVGFALATFDITLDNPDTQNGESDLETFEALYNAMNAALRSLGNRPAVALIKGPHFFLGMQLARLRKDNGPKGALRNLKKTIKNCAHCSEADFAKLEKIRQSLPV